MNRLERISCDLLSISGTTIFDNNTGECVELIKDVVICFQFQEQRSLITTLNPNLQAEFSCDLLSISGTTIFDNNYK